MRKLLVTCECGQQIHVPRSAIGKSGLCPTCGAEIQISAGNTQPMPRGRRDQFLAGRPMQPGRVSDTPEGAKQKFGEAVDLYYSKRFGESLALFDALAKQYPGNADIEHGRAQCLRGMKGPAQVGAVEIRKLEAPGKFDEETVKRVILDKLIHGTNDTVQLKAAELAGKMLGVFEGTAATEKDGGRKDFLSTAGDDSEEGSPKEKSANALADEEPGAGLDTADALEEVDLSGITDPENTSR